MNDLHRPTGRTYASITRRKSRGRQKYRWALRVLDTNDTQGPQESYANAEHALRMAVRGTGFKLVYADLSDPAFVKLYGYSPYYAILIEGWGVGHAVRVFGEEAIDRAATQTLTAPYDDEAPFFLAR